MERLFIFYVFSSAWGGDDSDKSLLFPTSLSKSYLFSCLTMSTTCPDSSADRGYSLLFCLYVSDSEFCGGCGNVASGTV